MRALKAAVVGMAVLIVVGVVTLAVLLVQRVGGSPAALAASVLDEPAGTRIAALSTTPDRVWLLLQGGGVDRLVSVESRTGRVVGRVSLAR